MLGFFFLNYKVVTLDNILQWEWCGRQERAVDIFYLDFIKAFDTVSHKILTEKVMKHRLDDQPVRWTEKRLGREGGQQLAPSLAGGQRLAV